MKKGLADKAKKLRDDAIFGEALNHRVFASSDEYAQHLPNAIDRWNGTAKWLEKTFGGFGLRLEQTGAGSFKFKLDHSGSWKRALGMLWTLCSERPLPNHRKMPDLDWMFDWLMLAGMSQDKINWEATARQGAWNVRIRKTKAGIAAKQAAALRDQMADLKQDQLKERRRELFRRQAELDQLVVRCRKIDPTDLDRYVVNWPHHIVGHQYGIGVLVPINEPHIIVDQLVADCEARDDDPE